jgi:hypothetical protein
MTERASQEGEAAAARAFIIFRQDEPGNHNGTPVAVYTEDQREACQVDLAHKRSVNPDCHYYVLDKKLNPRSTSASGEAGTPDPTSPDAQQEEGE